jgi:hypothetical protein
MLMLLVCYLLFPVHNITFPACKEMFQHLSKLWMELHIALILAVCKLTTRVTACQLGFGSMSTTEPARAMQFNHKQDKPQEERGLNRKLKDSDSNAHHDFAYTMFAATRSTRRSLIKFIRMSDYMLGSALRSVLISSCKAVVDTLVTRNCSPALSDSVRCFFCPQVCTPCFCFIFPPK